MVLRSVSVVALLVGLAALSGCMGSDGTSSSTTGRTCPSWVVGLSSAQVQGGFDQRIVDNPTNDTFLEGLDLMDEGRPIDVYYIHMNGNAEEGDTSVPRHVTVTDARVHMRFFRLDTHDPLPAYDMALGPPGSQNTGRFDWVFGPGTTNVLLQVRLSQPPALPDPTALLVEYTYDMDLDNNDETPSHAEWRYSVQYEYRAC